MKLFASSGMKDKKSEFCWASISRSPPVKKSTTSKLVRFLALYSSFFLVNASLSVRRVESHKPVSVPRRSMVAMACDTDSCRYPFSSPMRRMCFFCGGTDWAVENPLSTARVIRARGAIFIIFAAISLRTLSMGDMALFQQLPIPHHFLGEDAGSAALRHLAASLLACQIQTPSPDRVARGWNCLW